MKISDIEPGQTVRVKPADKWYACNWFPKTDYVTGLVEKIAKNGNITVAVNGARNSGHTHGRVSCAFRIAEIVEIVSE